jgi:flavin reductase (DIM6/NTAB) family NADH-FMN oxidoreductase RutF
MQFDFEAMSAIERYKIMVSTIVPRPIAWVVSLDPEGRPNAAPYSFFNAMGNDPPIVCIGVQRHPENRFKDTSHNILLTSQFVVNLVSEATAEAMNITCIDAPPGVDELKLAGLETVASVKVKPPRIAASPVAFECVVHTVMNFSPNQAMVIGRIVHAHVQDDCVLDAAKHYIDTPKLKLVGRMHGSGTYSRTNDRFQMDRPVWAEWMKAGKV